MIVFMINLRPFKIFHVKSNINVGTQVAYYHYSNYSLFLSAYFFVLPSLLTYILVWYHFCIKGMIQGHDLVNA